jgi:hypothetical protein
VRQDDRDQWKITGSLRRGEERMELSEPSLIVGGRLSGGASTRSRVLDDSGAFPWITRLSTLKQIPFPDRERDSVMSKLLDLNVVPPLGRRRGAEVRRAPRATAPRTARHAAERALGRRIFQALLLLDYGRGWTESASAGRGLWFPEGARLSGARHRIRGRRAREAQGTRSAPARRSAQRLAPRSQVHAQGGP